MTSDVAEASTWLRQNGFSDYTSLFAEKNIGLSTLHSLSNAELGKLGVPIGVRKRLINALRNASLSEPLAPTREVAREAIRESPRASTSVIPSAASDTVRAQRRNVTVMFVDLAESTQLSVRLDPEDYARTIKEFQSHTIGIVETWNGFIAQFFGDGVLAYFGWPTASENDAERAVRAALSITEEISTLFATDGSQLACRVGIATGLVVVGDTVGDQSHEAIFGITPDLAAELQSQARFGEVIISAATHKLVRNWFDTTLVGSVELDGIDGTTEVWRAERATGSTTRFDAGFSDRTRMTPFSGRQSEVQDINRHWQHVVDHSGSAILISAEAGLGKSRLIREFIGESASAAANVTYLQCSPFHTNTVAHPIVDHLTASVGLTSTLNSQIFLDRLYKILQASGIQSSESAQRVAWFIGLGGGNKAGSDSRSTAEPELSKTLQAARVKDDFVRYLLGLANSAPLVLVVEDVHWIDATTAEILGELVQVISNYKVLMLVTTRPGSQLPWCDQFASTVELYPLAESDATALTRSLAGEFGISDDVLKSILQATNGVPLFLEEVTNMLLESGQLQASDNLYDFGSTISVPHRLRDALVAKIDALPLAKSLIGLAATIGRDFPYDLLKIISGKDDQQLTKELSELIDHAVLVVDDNTENPRFTFRHILLQEAAYSMLLLADKRELHLRIALALENQQRPAPQVLAHHYEQANHVLSAAENFLLAGNRALERSAVAEAIAMLDRGIDLLEAIKTDDANIPDNEDTGAMTADRLRLNLHASVGTAQMSARGWGAPEVDEAYRNALTYLPAAENNLQRLRVAWGAWVHKQVSGRVSEAAELAKEIDRVASLAGDEDGLLIARMVGLQSCFYSGRFNEAIRHGTEFEELFDDSRHTDFKNQYSTDLLLVWYVHAAQAFWLTGDSEAAQGYYRKIPHRIEQVQHKHSETWAVIWGANYLLLTAEHEAVLSLVPEARLIAGNHGFLYTDCLGHIIETDAQLRTAIATKKKIEVNHGAIEAFKQTGARIVVPWFQARRAELIATTGTVAEALELIDASIAQIEHTGEYWCAAYCYRVKGDLLLMQSGEDAENAIGNYKKGVEVSSEQGLVPWLADAEARLARLF